MSRELLNTLYILTPGAYARLDGETVRVELDGEKLIQVPLLHIGSIVLFGATSLTPQLMMRCAEEGKNVVFLDYGGNFKARVVGAESGNVLLREAQYRAFSDKRQSLQIARPIVAGKIKNCRANLLRALREGRIEEEGKVRIEAAIDGLATLLKNSEKVEDIDVLRGLEGQAAAFYFEVFGYMVLPEESGFYFMGRNRRPPRDRVNALMSFIYALLLSDCESALRSVGLDSQFGFLHALRAGRSALALDLLEEFRASLGDRLVLSLINKHQVSSKHFEERAGGSVNLNEQGRKIVIGAYQRRKQEEVQHPLLKSKVPFGLVPQLQARLLARFLRGDTPSYVPFVVR